MADPKKPDEPDAQGWKSHPDAPYHVGPGEARVPVGGVVCGDGDIELNAGRPTTTLKVRNTGDRPIQVCSHFHFFEVNRYLEFDRKQAFGKRLDVPSTTAIRFEPGDEKEVTLVPMSGKQYCHGFNNLVDGWTGPGPHPDFHPNFDRAMRRAQARGYKGA